MKNLNIVFKTPHTFCLTFLAGILLLSCGGETSRSIEERQESRAEMRETREKERDSIRNLKADISTRYGVSSAIDTADYFFTIEYQQLLEQTEHFLLTDYAVRDIIKESDSLYRVVLHTGLLNLKFFNLRIGLPEIEKLLAAIQEPNKLILLPDSKNPYLIIRVMNVKKLKFDPVSFEDIGILRPDNGDGDSAFGVRSDHFIFTGSIVDIVPAARDH